MKNSNYVIVHILLFLIFYDKINPVIGDVYEEKKFYINWIIYVFYWN